MSHGLLKGHTLVDGYSWDYVIVLPSVEKQQSTMTLEKVRFLGQQLEMTKILVNLSTFYSIRQS